MSELVAIWVVNTGYEIPDILSLSAKYLRVSFLHLTDDVTYFETPTIRLLHKCAIFLTVRGYFNVQFLYLHTKGISYSDINYSAVVSWRQMMLYFLVGNHRRPWHLLSSGEFDTVGILTGISASGKYCYRGNMWWASSSYLSKLPQVTYNKQAAEDWLFQVPAGTRHRNYTLHNTNNDIYYNVHLKSDYIYKNDMKKIINKMHCL